MSFVLLHVVLFSEIIGVKLGIAGERLGEDSSHFGCHARRHL